MKFAFGTDRRTTSSIVTRSAVAPSPSQGEGRGEGFERPKNALPSQIKSERRRRVGRTQPTAGAPALRGLGDCRHLAHGTGAPAPPGLGDFRRARRCAIIATVLTTIGLFTLGCEKPVTQIEIVSFEQERLGAEQFVESFPDGNYTRDAYQNVNITFEIPPTLVTIERPATTAELAAMERTKESTVPNEDETVTAGDVVIRANTSSEEGAESTEDASASEATIEEVSDDDAIPMIEEQVYIAQLLHVEMLWQPRPGKTYAERTQTDAGITYCLQRGADRARYEGAGFVYFTLEDDGRTIVGEIESATLYPAGATDESVAVLGPCRIRGPFVATLSANGVMNVKRRIRSEFSGLDEGR